MLKQSLIIYGGLYVVHLYPMSLEIAQYSFWTQVSHIALWVFRV